MKKSDRLIMRSWLSFYKKKSVKNLQGPIEKNRNVLIGNPWKINKYAYSHDFRYKSLCFIFKPHCVLYEYAGTKIMNDKNHVKMSNLHTSSPIPTPFCLKVKSE